MRSTWVISMRRQQYLFRPVVLQLERQPLEKQTLGQNSAVLVEADAPGERMDLRGNQGAETYREHQELRLRCSRPGEGPNTCPTCFRLLYLSVSHAQTHAQTHMHAKISVTVISWSSDRRLLPPEHKTLGNVRFSLPPLTPGTNNLG